jgi:trehalose 6-phosphate phosphatase
MGSDVEEQEHLSAANALHRVLVRRPLGVFLDVDGTISQLTSSPQDAVVSTMSRSLLKSLSSHAVVAIVSGRTLVDARRMVGVDGLTYVGSHGLAMWIDGKEVLDAAVRPYVELAQRAMVELAPLRRVDGILFEEKVTGLAVHYRLTRDPQEARSAILRAIAASGSAAHFDIIEGVKVVELRPRLGLNKGTSVRSLVNHFRLEGLIYAGDDLTDVEAFEAVRDLRKGGRIDGLSIAVHHAESPPLVEASADFVVDGVEGTQQLLRYVLKALSGSDAVDRAGQG